MKYWRQLFFIVIAIAGCLPLSCTTHAQQLPTNLFDISQGTQIISHTPTHTTSNARNLFGNSYNSSYPSEADNLLFDDRQPQGTVHSVEWTTGTPIELTDIKLSARHDNNFNRSFDQFRFYAQQPDGTMALVDSQTITTPYGSGTSGNELIYSANITPVPSQRFRAEFVQHAAASLSSGPRVIELSGYGSTLPAVAEPVTDDLFDISQGVTITNHSPTFNTAGTSDIADMFGGTFTNIPTFPEETGQTLFEDGQPQGTSHFVEWRTSQPITLQKIHLHAAHDPHAPNNPNQIRDANQRGFSKFTLFTKDDTGNWQSIYQYQPANPYGQGSTPYFNELHIAADIPNITAQEFRAEFQQYGPANNLNSGPRITELDGFGEVTAPAAPSILFVPGLKASRLYLQENGHENRLWEPNRNLDVEKLLLNNQGQSINPDIYTRDVVDEAFTQNIYKSFLSFLNDLKTEGTITNWQTTPYDWRLANQDNSYEVIASLRQLANATPNQPITIITHSNGALVTAAALAQLVNQNDPLLQQINRIIYVAAPHRGTPSAAAALLHGYDQQLLGGFILKTSTARQLAEHMASAFELLPTTNYFSNIADPVISFDDSLANLDFFHDADNVNSTTSLRDFITGVTGNRTEPADSDILTPNVLTSSFFDNATAAHAAYDNLQLPNSIETINIIGWGLDTIKGINYFAKQDRACINKNEPTCRNGYTLDLRPELTVDGDRTVTNSSSTATEGDIFYMNLYARNKKGINIDLDHGDILETEELSLKIKNLITGSNSPVEFVSENKPVLTAEDKRLRLSVHSPVTLSIYDNQGNHTGLTENDQTDLQLTEEQILNSYYFELGEGKYAGADFDSTRTIQLSGTGFGSFDFTIDEVHGDQVAQNNQFKNVPVTPSTTATLVADPNSSQRILQIDIDGDGTNDASFSGAEPVPLSLHWQTLRSLINSIDLFSAYRHAMSHQVEIAERLSHNPHTHRAARQLLKHVNQKIKQYQRRHQIDDEKAQLIRDTIQLILENM